MAQSHETCDETLKDLFFRYEDALAKSDLVKLEGFFQPNIKFVKIGMKGQREGIEALRAHHVQLFEKSHSGADIRFRETISLSVMSFGEGAGITQSEFVDALLPTGYRGFQTLTIDFATGCEGCGRCIQGSGFISLTASGHKILRHQSS